MPIARRAAVFLVLTFAISLSALAVAWHQGMRDLFAARPIFQLSAFGPGIAALICMIAFERGQRLQALGLRFVPNRWWLAALLVPAALCAITIAVNLIASGAGLFDAAGWSQELAAVGQGAINRQFPNLAVALIIMIIVNTLAEELGWRGYLHHLWRRFGFATAALGAGAVQGIWHWPLVVLFGIGFTGNTLIDMALYPLFTAMLGVYHTLLRERGASVVAAGIFHGAVNVFGSSNGGGPGRYVMLTLLVLGAAFILFDQRRTRKNPRNSSADSASPIPE